MENPLSLRANAFAIASIMSDPSVALDSTGSAAGRSSAGYGYVHGSSSSMASHLHHRQGPTDCRFQLDWSGMQDNSGYSTSGGLKAMEGQRKFSSKYDDNCRPIHG